MTYKDAYINIVKKNNNIKNNILKLGILFEDLVIKKHFKSKASSQIYHQHIVSGYDSCVFCEYLDRSSCHNFCFSCVKNTYNECDILLPGISSYTDTYFDTTERTITPWIFRNTCSCFKRLEENTYFRNFVSIASLRTVENYEMLEGLFLGLVHGQRPCHICASVSVNTLKKCLANGSTSIKNPCASIMNILLTEYNSNKTTDCK